MKITVDTNVLVRAAVRDDEKQGRAAAALLEKAEIVAIPLACLCEFVWVLRKVYGFRTDDIASALDVLMNSKNVVLNRQAAEAGLTIFIAGGDFADGVIQHEGEWLGGETFASFDARAVALLAKGGVKSMLVS